LRTDRWRFTAYHRDRKQGICPGSIVENDRIRKFDIAASTDLGNDIMISPVTPKHVANNFINTGD
jgi:hypothetical protein